MLKQSEKVILAGLILPAAPDRGEAPLRRASGDAGPAGGGSPADSLEELGRLVESAGGMVVGHLIQKRDARDPAFLIGKGKALELAELVRRLDCRCAIFDEELSPTQQRNLENLLMIKVIDRTRLILDVFAQRAKTREGMLQVELAQYNYLLSRLTGRGRELSQQVGGIGVRGPGERALEYDRRRIRAKIQHIQKELTRVRRERAVQRARRVKEGIVQVAIIGYTNVGKSSLLNAILNLKQVGPRQNLEIPKFKFPEGPAYADDRLFATLDPMTRRVYLPCGVPILLTDTVGFISKLPTHLITSFRATLEEIQWASLILHISDPLSPPEVRIQREKEVAGILEMLKVSRYPQIHVFSKADLVKKSQREIFGAPRLWISSKTGEGIAELLSAIENRLLASWPQAHIRIKAQDGNLLASLYQTGRVLDFRSDGKGGYSILYQAPKEQLGRWTKNRGQNS